MVLSGGDSSKLTYIFSNRVFVEEKDTHLARKVGIFTPGVDTSIATYQKCLPEA
jgi:hypothetical protein